MSIEPVPYDFDELVEHARRWALPQLGWNVDVVVCHDWGDKELLMHLDRQKATVSVAAYVDIMKRAEPRGTAVWESER